MIAYLSLPNGEELPPRPRDTTDYLGGDVSDFIVGVFLENIVDLEFPAPGVRDITPRLWTANRGQHELVTLDNGEALYRIIPIGEGVSTTYLHSDPSLNSSKQGGRQIAINNEEPRVALIGGHPHKPGLCLFGIVHYLPDTLS